MPAALPPPTLLTLAPSAARWPGVAPDRRPFVVAAPGFSRRAYAPPRTRAARAVPDPALPFPEASPTTGYPGGCSLLRVDECGYAMNCYKCHETAAQEWCERSRPEYFGAGPTYTLGNVADRNYVVARDMSGLQRA